MPQDLSVIAALALKKQDREEAADVADWFRDVVQDRIADGNDLSDRSFWISLLSDWAQSVIDEAL